MLFHASFALKVLQFEHFQGNFINILTEVTMYALHGICENKHLVCVWNVSSLHVVVV